MLCWCVGYAVFVVVVVVLFIILFHIRSFVWALTIAQFNRVTVIEHSSKHIYYENQA